MKRHGSRFVVIFYNKQKITQVAFQNNFKPYDKYFATIGMRRPMPKALPEMRSMGGV